MVATTDFGTVVGVDRTLTTAPPPPSDGHPSISRATASGTVASVKASCTGRAGARCTLSFKLTAHEKLRNGKVIAVTARTRKVTLGSASTTLLGGQSKTVKIQLNRTGKHLLSVFHQLPATLTVSQTLLNGRKVTVSVQTGTFRKRRA
jgi:hypothetical protein